jgi:hypothetical protein
MPFQKDSKSGILFREFRLKVDGVPMIFVQQICDDGILCWRKTPSALTVFPQKFSNSRQKMENDRLVELIISLASEGNLEGLRKVLNRCDNPELLVEQNPDLLFHFNKKFQRRGLKGTMQRCISLANLSMDGEAPMPFVMDAQIPPPKIHPEILNMLIDFGFASFRTE